MAAGIGLGQYADTFEANDVEMDLLKEADDQMLKDIGMTSAGHRLRLVGVRCGPRSTRPA